MTSTTRTTTSRCVAALAGVTIVTGLLGMHSKQAMAADSWPTRPVKILVPFAAGGNTDVIARLTADRLMNAIKDSSFLVENQPGGGGVTVTTQVARAAPDGYTLLMAASPQLVIAPAIQSVKFDPAKDFTPIKIITNNPVVLMAHKSLPAEDVPGLLVHVRAIGPKFSYASGSLGSLSHLASALLFNKAGLEATPVHYRGGAPAMNDVLAGHLPMMFANLSEVLAQSGNADIKLLAVSSARRVLQLPDVPTVAEKGIAGFDMVTFNGLVGPAGMSPDVVKRLETVLAEFVSAADVQARLRTLGLEADQGSSADFADRIRRELPVWASVVELAGAKQ